MDGDRLDRGQDWLQRGSPSEAAGSARTGRGASERDDGRGGGTEEQGGGAKGGRAAGGPGRVKGGGAENRDPRKSHETSAQVSGFFSPGGSRRAFKPLTAFIHAHRPRHGVEPICRVLPI